MLIFTKYHPATGSRGARISAHSPGTEWGRVYISFPYELSGAQRHWQAARALIKKAGYLSTASGAEWRAHSLPDGFAFSGNLGFFEIISFN